MNPHDLPIAESDEFYQEQDQGPLHDYPRFGNEANETSYFLRMYLSCLRAADYLASRPDWDGRTFVVLGASQGGLQTPFTAAMCPRVTAARAEVPAGSDQWGPDVARSPGWPNWLDQAWDRDQNKVRATALYYDINHFAPKIQCPTLIGVGLIDTVVPPPGVYATYNQIGASKEILPMAHAEHSTGHEAYWARVEEWLKPLQAGAPAPVAAGK